MSCYNALNRSSQPTLAWNSRTRREKLSAEGTDRVHSVILTAGINEIAGKIDLQLSYDHNGPGAYYEYSPVPFPIGRLPRGNRCDHDVAATEVLPA